MKSFKKWYARMLIAAMLLGLVTVSSHAQAKSSKKVKLNKTSVTLTVGKTTTLKLKNAPKGKKITWSSSKKKVATVTKKGKVTAKKAGKATIICKVKGKKYTCKVTVKDKRTDSGALNITITKKASDTGLGPKLPYSVISKFYMEDGKGVRYECSFSNQEEDIINANLRRAGGDHPYGVNKITVTCDGKDVTNKAKYKIDEPQVACVESPGVIRATTRGIRFKLTVSYKGAKKTFVLGKTTVSDWYTICCGALSSPGKPAPPYCGAVFAEDECANIYSSEAEKENCPFVMHQEENGCARHLMAQYVRYIDIRIK